MWTETDLCRQCAKNASEVVPLQARSEQTFTAVWSALRAWLVALFAKCRGGSIPNFARFAWHHAGVAADGSFTLRPSFVLSDAYVRSHQLNSGSGVLRMSHVAELELEPCEDFNALRVALKHSQSLTKDIVYSCSRQLLQQLGQALRSGQPVSVNMGVGVLSGHNRTVSFAFKPTYLVHAPAHGPTPHSSAATAQSGALAQERSSRPQQLPSHAASAHVGAGAGNEDVAREGSFG
ncbi:hypothetical protein Agub_g3535, partial [Astrephomene gubernaculifera]